MISTSACLQPKQPSLDDIRESQRLIDQGTLLLRQGELNLARGSFSVAAEIHPSAAAFDGLGCVAMLEKRFSIAQSYFIRAYQEDSNYSNALGNLALLYEILGVISEVERLYQLVLRQDPKNYRIRNNYAAFLDRQGEKGEIGVADQLHKAFSLVPHPLIKDNLEAIGRR